MTVWVGQPSDATAMLEGVTDVPALVAVAHGTRDPAGPAVLTELLDGVRELLPDVEVRVAYVDVIEPMLADVLAGLAGRAVVVPMFLASGYHVRVDVPEAVHSTDTPALVTPALGPDDAVVAAVAARLREACQLRGAGPRGETSPLPDAVVLAAAGSSDAGALAEVDAAARKLAARLDRDVTPAYVTTAEPTVSDAVTALRAAGHATVGVASYLLAPGLFQRRLAEAGADVVAAPIGPHERVIALVAERYRRAAAACL